MTLRDVADEVGVSVATVSRVLNGRGDRRISEGTRKQVLAAARDLGYQPNPIARALVTGRTRMIGVAVPYVWYPFAPQVMHFVQEQVGPSGYGIVIQGAESDPQRYTLDLRAIVQQADGIIAVERSGNLRAFLDEHGPDQVPVVSVGADVVAEVDWVLVDLAPGARDAVRHLVASGCRRVAYLVPVPSQHEREPRRVAYDAVMGEVGAPPEHIVVPVGTRAAARQTLLSHVREHGLPDGLFCCNDVTAVGAYRALRDLGVQLPADCALVGCDGIEGGEYLDAPLSTIVQPIEEMCRLGCEFLLRRIKAPDTPPQTATLTAPLVIRESSRR